MFRKDSRFYANRLSKQMDKIANVGFKIEEYFYDSYQKCTNLEFTDDAIEAFRCVRGKSGGAAIETYRDIKKDVLTLHMFLNRWENSRNVDKKTIKFAKSFHHELVQLKNYMEDIPPDMMADVKNSLMQKRLRGYYRL